MTKTVQIGDATLILADCLDVLPTLSGVDAVVTDPPYGIGHEHWGGGGPVAGRWSCHRNSRMPIIGDNQPFDPAPWLAFPRVLFFGANHYADRLPTRKGSWIAWDKACNGGPNDSFSDCEFIWTTENVARNVARFQWKGVCTINVGEQNGRRWHPTQKPISLMLWCLEFIPGQTILDGYMGSGTTGVACLRTGRRFIGIEKEPKYFEIACKRIQTELDRSALFAGLPPEPIVASPDLFMESGQ